VWYSWNIFVLNSNPVQLELVKKMTTAMAHRGPNAVGFLEDENVALGHRRLSIIDLSEGANQPFADHSRRYQMVYNGELFNFLDVKKNDY
jgi:asparagine synthase (glutamine-hydrolysing)